MLIDKLIETTLKGSRLKRVRIKVDPSQLPIHGYEHVTSFEGYVLHESIDSVEVYLLNLPSNFDPVQTVDRKHVTTVNDTPGNFETFKKKILNALQQDNVKTNNPAYQSIEKSNNDEFLETYLKNLGYDEIKIKNLYKKIIQTESTLNESDDLDLLPPWMKKAGDVAKKSAGVAGRAIDVYANIPRLIAGKKNIIGRVGKFIRSLNPRDLFEVDEYGPAKNSEFPSGVKGGDLVFITGLPFNLKKFKQGNFTYQIKGTTTKGLFEKNRKVNKIIDLEPMAVDRDIELGLDFSVLGNKEKIGTLVMDFRHSKEQTRYYKVKVTEYQNNKIINVLERISETEGKISHQMIQDEVRLAVKKSLEEFFGDRKVTDINKLINSISDKILQNGGQNKDKNLARFDKSMEVLLSTPVAMKSSNPTIYLNKQLKGQGLI